MCCFPFLHFFPAFLYTLLSPHISTPISHPQPTFLSHTFVAYTKHTQGFVFAFVGMCAGLAGTSISNGLLLLRQRLDPEYVTPNKPPNIVYNAATWSLHMGVSSNLRYQMLNGIDMVCVLLFFS